MYYAATASPLKRASEIELGTTRVPASPAGTKAQANLKVIPTNLPSSTGQRRNLHYIEAGKLILQGYRGAIIKKNGKKNTHLNQRNRNHKRVDVYGNKSSNDKTKNKQASNVLPLPISVKTYTIEKQSDLPHSARYKTMHTLHALS